MSVRLQLRLINSLNGSRSIQSDRTLTRAPFTLVVSHPDLYSHILNL